MSPLKIGIPLNFHLLLHLFFNHLDLKRSRFLWSWFNNDLGSPCTVSNSIVQYNNKSQYSIFFIDISSSFIVQPQVRQQHSIFKQHRTFVATNVESKPIRYIRGIITPYVSSTVILSHLQRASFVPNYKISVQQHPPSIPYIYPPTGSSTMYLEQPSWIHYTHHLIHQRYHRGCYHQRLIQLCSQIRQGKFELKHTQSHCCISSP